MKRDPYSEEYKKKVVSADEAALLVKDGFKLNFGDNICLSYDFDIALAKRINDLHDIVIISNTSTCFLCLTPPPSTLYNRNSSAFVKKPWNAPDSQKMPEFLEKMRPFQPHV